LGLGLHALMWSADIAVGEEEEVNFNGPIGIITVIFSLVLGIGLFFVIPSAASAGIEDVLNVNSSLIANLIEGLIRLCILLAYVSLIALMPDVRRLYAYHGAEHKTINAYESGDELTPENVAKYSVEHPRCGTAFMLIVVFVSILVYSLLGHQTLLWRFLSRVILIPVIAGIAYEYLRFTARYVNNRIVHLISKPNLALQHLTTREPDADMIEVAVTAFKRVLLSEQLITEEEAVIPTELKPQKTSFARQTGGD